MRISTIESDPGHVRGCYGVRVFLDGTEVSSVFTADEEQRLIVQADLDEHGRVRLTDDGSEVRTVTRYGHVRVELPPYLQKPAKAAEAFAYLFAKFNMQAPGDGFLISDEMLIDAFQSVAKASAFFSARSGELQQSHDGMHFLRKTKA